jgi:hypothetical protein
MFARLSLVRAFGSFSVVATLAAATTPALAQEPPPTAPTVVAPAAAPSEYTRKTYPMSMLERPLVLPKWVVEPTVGVGITNSDNGTGETFGLGFDIGVAKKLQVGAMIEVPAGPVADFGLLAFNLQTALGRSANLRFDIGVQRASAHVGEESAKNDAFVVGVGVPIKARINRWLAFVSGSNAARAFGGSPVEVVDRSGQPTQSTYGFGPPLSSNLLSLSVLPESSDDPHGIFEHTIVSGSMFLPVGLLVQPHERISLGVRTGYRLLFSHVSGNDGTTLVHYVPLAFDVVVSPLRQLDIGFTAQIQGRIDDNMDHTDARVPTPRWEAERQFNIWIGGRI